MRVRGAPVLTPGKCTLWQQSAVRCVCFAARQGFCPASNPVPRHCLQAGQGSGGPRQRRRERPAAAV